MVCRNFKRASILYNIRITSVSDYLNLYEIMFILLLKNTNLVDLQLVSKEKRRFNYNR